MDVIEWYVLKGIVKKDCENYIYETTNSQSYNNYLFNYYGNFKYNSVENK